MTIRKIRPGEWSAYFDGISHQMAEGDEGWSADIEVFLSESGDQQEATHIPLQGITYDRRDNRLEIASDDLRHMIVHPREIWADPGDRSPPDLLLVVREDGTRESVVLKRQ
ncbi:MAG: DUF5335 family protein [Gemmatimonadota bacterium]